MRQSGGPHRGDRDTAPGLPRNLALGCLRLAIVGGSLLGWIIPASQVDAALVAPTLSAKVLSASQIQLNWTDLNTNETGYRIERSLTATSGFTLVFTASRNATSYTNTGLTSGTKYYYRVRAIGRKGTASTYSNVASATTFKTDTSPPSVPTYLTATAVSTSQINLSWHASTDNTGGSGLKGYKIYRNTSFLKQVLAPATSTSDTGLSASTTFSYTFSAIDNAANESAQSGPPVSATTPAVFNYSLNTNAASLSLVQGSSVNTTVSLSLLAGTSQAVSLSVSGLPSGVSASFTNSPCSPSCTSTLTLTASATATLGSGPLTITGSPLAKTTTLSLTVQAPLDTTPPTVSLSPSPAGPTYTSAQTITLTAAASDNIGVTKVEFYDGTVLKATRTISPYLYDWSVTATDNGIHTWTAQAFDLATNHATSNTIAMTVAIDGQPPSAPAGLIVTPVDSTTLQTAWNPSTDNVGVMGYRLDVSTVSTFTVFVSGYNNQDVGNVTSISVSGLSPNTTYYMQLRAYDATGNVSANSATSSGTTKVLPPPPPTPPPLTGNVFYVAPVSHACNPSSPGTGTRTDPYKNVYYALTQGQIACGDTVQLRGGTYRIKANGYAPDSTAQDGYNACDEDQVHTGGYDGTHTVLPLFKQCTASNPLIIENYPGEDVILEGADADLDTGNVWTPCESSSQCGPATGMALTEYTRTYYTTAFNASVSRNPQFWVDPTPSTSGMRLGWWANGPNKNYSNVTTDHDQLGDGKFFALSVGGGTLIVVRLPDGSDPDTHQMKMTCQAGDCAYGVITANGASYITVQKNPAGGTFRVKYGYHTLYVTGNAQHITFDGLEVMGGGGSDYGGCLRTLSGSYITFKNGLCHETMGEGIAHYGGGPGASANLPGVQLDHNTVENSLIYDNGRGWIDGGGKGTNLGMGIILKNCSDCAAIGNTVHDTYRDGISATTSTDGCGGVCSSNNVRLERNIVFNTCHAADQLAAYPPVQKGAGSSCGGISVSEQGTGVVDGALISNNIVRGDYANPAVDTPSPGIYLDDPMPNVQVVNNSIRNVGGACIDVRYDTLLVTIENNAMDRCSQAANGWCNGFRCDLMTQAPLAHLLSHNTYWAANSSDTVVNNVSGALYTRSTVTTLEPTAVQADPTFVSPTDLHLQPTSPLIDRGMDLGVLFSNDIDGNPRPQGSAWDIGADEVP